jgi:hypothetical protein
VQDVHPRALGRERVGELARAVGRAVVDDQQLEPVVAKRATNSGSASASS